MKSERDIKEKKKGIKMMSKRVGEKERVKEKTE